MTTGDVAAILARLGEMERARDQAREDLRLQRAEDMRLAEQRADESRNAHRALEVKVDALSSRIADLEERAITWPRLGAIVGSVASLTAVLAYGSQHINIK